MNEERRYTIELTEQQVAFLEQVLIECPYKHVAEILATINEQRHVTTE